MTKVAPIIELHPWLALPPGQALLEWEQAQFDRLVADVFGFHAIQLGLPELDGLRTNRMQHRWLALDASYDDWMVTSEDVVRRNLLLGNVDQVDTGALLSLRCDFESLPFPSNSLDLVVLPHALELAHDPHRTLREVERVLVPEGKVVISCFNPASLWGMYQRLGQWGMNKSAVLPQGEFIAHWRLRDWLRLLDLEVAGGGFGCYRPFVTNESWWTRLRWMESAGERWWPVLGSVYFLVAVKRVRGMRLVGKIKKARLNKAPAPAVVAQRHQRQGVTQQDVNG
ncbi:class I SAM-dependent methyltransferase [Aquabacterium sp.]|uniref:class I SAM-dependent methyltransferase n=1 Tax=Aquabacterium sp. TaxID=1872578 RepID=UPI002E3725FC|nr:class I SAM-dependent methyltransferase [Aquabacterium sp.]HEX5312245.1 class I SAM-dependent methyltransferase [Aquabacterium sp.]